MDDQQGGFKKKMSSWLHTRQKDGVQEQMPAKEGGRKVYIFKKPQKPTSESSGLPGQSLVTNTGIQPETPTSSAYGASYRSPNTPEAGKGALTGVLLHHQKEDDIKDRPPDENGDGFRLVRFRLDITDETWRETVPSMELMLATGQQKFDFCDPPSRHWVRRIPLPSNLFGDPMDADVQPIAPSQLPPRLFDLLLNRTVSTAGLGDTSYTVMSHVWGETSELDGRDFGVNWQIPVSSRQKLTDMLEFARILGGMRYFWVDILCLDQTKSNEHETLRMKSYYTNASRCLVWLDKSPGQGPDEWSRVLDAIESINELFRLDKHGHPNVTLEQMLEEDINTYKIDKPQAFELAGQLVAIEKASWFKRVWTLQEAVIPEMLLLCTPERYMISGAELFRAISFHAMVASLYIDQGRDEGTFLLSMLQHSEIWKTLRLRQLYRKHQVSFWHIVQATKSRQCRKDQDRVFGILGLVHGFEPAFGPTVTAETLLENLHTNYLRAGDLSALMYLSNQKTIGYHPASRGLILSGAYATKRSESHGITLLDNNSVRLEEFSMDVVTAWYAIVGTGSMFPWYKRFPTIEKMADEVMIGIARAWDIDADAFPEDLRPLLIFALHGFTAPNERVEQIFKARGEEIWTLYKRAGQKAIIIWMSINTQLRQLENRAVAVAWTKNCGPILALLTETPKSYANIVTPSSYLLEPGEGCLFVTSEGELETWKKIGIGLSPGIKTRCFGTITLMD